MKIIRSSFLIFLLCIALISACAESATETYPMAKNSNYDLCVGSTTEMSGCFFTEMWGNNAADMDVRFLLNGYNLVYWDNAVGGYQTDPNVVSGLIVTDDPNGNRTYTLAINHELAYSDGTPINAKDYVFSILLQMSPEIRKLGGQLIGSDFIVGAQAYKNGETKRLQGVRLIDDYHFGVTVSADYLPNFYELSLLNYYPYPIHVLAPGCEITGDNSGVAIENADQTLDADLFTVDLLRETVFDEETGYMSHPSVVSGPYTLVSFDGKTARFEVNRQYKGNPSAIMPMIPRIVMTLAENETMIEKLASNEFNLLNRCMDPDAVREGLALTQSGDYSSTGYARDGFCSIHFCCEQPTVSDQAVRQAIAMCLNKDELIERILGDVGNRVDGFYGLGQWTYQMVTGSEDLDTQDVTVDLEGLNLDDMRIYDLDVAAAVELLEEDGWTLNTMGEAYDSAKDAVRCKMIDGAIVPLELKLVYPEGNVVGENLQDTFAENLRQAGIALELEARSMPDLLKLLYRQQERDCDMIYVAMNFDALFDPSLLFSTNTDEQGVLNCTGIMDEELYQKAVEMRKVQPGDIAEYCKRWVAFQERWAEVLPAIPVYSNTYYDFYTARLQDYKISGEISWAEAIVPSYMRDITQ